MREREHRVLCGIRVLKRRNRNIYCAPRSSSSSLFCVCTHCSCSCVVVLMDVGSHCGCYLVCIVDFSVVFSCRRRWREMLSVCLAFEYMREPEPFKAKLTDRFGWFWKLYAFDRFLSNASRIKSNPFGVGRSLPSFPLYFNGRSCMNRNLQSFALSSLTKCVTLVQFVTSIIGGSWRSNGLKRDICAFAAGKFVIERPSLVNETQVHNCCKLKASFDSFALLIPWLITSPECQRIPRNCRTSAKHT